jgi:hypothetical protein
MAEQQATMSLPLDLIKPAIEAKINAAVIEALGAQEQLILKVVEQIMARQVGSDGKPPSYISGKTMPWLTWAVRDITEKAIVQAINDNIGKNAEKIKAAIDAEMRKSKSPLVQSMIVAMADGMATAAASRYGIKVIFDDK